MAKRVDAVQPEIVAALRQIGASVTSLHAIGHGVCDILVGYQGVNYLLECKSPRGRFTADELYWHALWKGRIGVVRSVEEALAAIGAEMRGDVAEAALKEGKDG